MNRLAIAGMVACVLLASSAAVTVRVKTSAAGVPQIHVDGRPVRPRMFWGWHGHRPIIAGTEWKSFAFEVAPKSGDPGTLHLRIPSGRDVEVLFRNVRIVDAETGTDYLDPASLASSESFAKAWTIFDNDTAGHAELKDGCLRMAGWAKVRGPKRPPHFHCYTKRTPFAAGHTYRVSFEAKASKPDVPLTPAEQSFFNFVAFNKSGSAQGLTNSPACGTVNIVEGETTNKLNYRQPNGNDPVVQAYIAYQANPSQETQQALIATAMANGITFAADYSDVEAKITAYLTPLCAEHVMMRGLNDAGAPVFDFGSAFPLLGYDGVNSYLQTLSTIVAEQQGGAPAPYAASNEQKAAMPNHCAIYYQGMMLVMGLAPYVA